MDNHAPMDARVPPTVTDMNCEARCKDCCSSGFMPKARTIPTNHGLLVGAAFIERGVEGGKVFYIAPRPGGSGFWDPQFGFDPSALFTLRCRYSPQDRRRIAEDPDFREGCSFSPPSWEEGKS